MDIALTHVGTYRAGEAGYYGPRPRGHLEVWYDSKRYLYDLNGWRVKAGECREFIMRAWNCWCQAEVVGSYPSYCVERRQ